MINIVTKNSNNTSIQIKQNHITWDNLVPRKYTYINILIYILRLWLIIKIFKALCFVDWHVELPIAGQLPMV